MSTEGTLNRHLQAIAQGADAIMADYTEESVLFTQNGPFVGLAAIRGFFEAFIAGAPPELIPAVRVTRADVHGEVAYIIWQAEPFIPLALAVAPPEHRERRLHVGRRLSRHLRLALPRGTRAQKGAEHLHHRPVLGG